MFTEVADDLVDKAISAELSQAKMLYGTRYSSDHEGWAVLKEEIEEAMSDFSQISKSFRNSWEKIKQNETVKNDLDDIIVFSKLLALEAIQICAVSTKWRNK